MRTSSTSEEIAPIEEVPEMLPATTGVDAEVDIEVLKVVPKKFCVVDEKTANWLVRKIVQSRQYAATVKEWAAREQRRAEREEMSLMFLFGRQLQTWVRDELEKLQGRRKSINLPAGIVKFHSVAASLQIDDEAAVIKWAQQHCPDAIVTVSKLSKSVLNDLFKNSGEVPDSGAHVEPEKEIFSIR